jgi:hypothetical protein
MDITVAANPDRLPAAQRARLERIMAEVLDSRTARIPQIIVCLEVLDACRSQCRWECRIYARLLTSGTRTVVGDGNDAETALRGAAAVLARSLGAEDGCYSTSGRVGSR